MLSKRSFLLGVFAVLGAAARAQKRGTFLQLNLYDRMPEKALEPYFEALDRHYNTEMARAPGLILYQRFHHYDLPEKVSIEIWESEEAAKAWHDGRKARELWKAVLHSMPPGVGAEYREPMHSMAHRHYVLERDFTSR